MGEINSITPGVSIEEPFSLKSAAYQTFKACNKFRKVAKNAVSVASEFSGVPALIEKIMRWSSTFKLAKGVFATRKLKTSVKKFIHRSDLFDRVYEGFRATKAIKYMLEGVEAALKYMRDFKMISGEALRWTKTAGTIFIPVSYITTTFFFIFLKENLRFMKEFRASTAMPKNEISLIGMEEACAYILKNRLALKKIKAIKKDCPLKETLKRIQKQLKTGTEIERQKAFAEGQIIIDKLKGRISARVFSQGCDTALCAIQSVGTTFALAFPYITLPVALIDLFATSLQGANFAITRYIPTGRFKDDEQPSFMAKPLASLIA